MATPTDMTLANKRFEFASAAFGDDKFSVVEMEGFESISRPFRFTLTLVSSDASIDFDTMLNNPAIFTIYGPNGTMPTPYRGVLAEFEQLHRADGYVFYRAVLVPRLWRLSLYRLSEVYLNEQTIPEIVEGVLKNGGLLSTDYEFKLTGSYRPRSFVCQYEETYLDFVSRWLEKEGIYYYFDHAGSTEKLVVLDDRIMHDASVLPLSYRPDDALDTGVTADSVRALVCRQKPLPRAVVLQDYNYRKAALALKARATVSESGIGEVTLYGENFRDEDEGNRYAKLRAQEIACGGKVFHGEGTAVGLRSGYVFELAHHYRDDFNGRYLVTEIHHEGSQAGALLSGVRSSHGNEARGGEIIYRNQFRAIPAQTQFRAERVTSRPRVTGTMNATIDSEGSGQYADLDEYGQYKVQLPFDKTDKNANKGSARIRMTTPYSGSGHGMHFPLHKAAEVLLSFIDGDPDQPVIVGSLPNSENANLVAQENAHLNSIKTAGGNQIYMSDLKGREAIRLYSPNGSSYIGLGAVDGATKDGGSNSGKASSGGKEFGIWSFTTGTSGDVTKGNSLSIKLTEAASVTVGNDHKISAGMETKVALSLGLSFKAGSEIGVSYGANLDYGDKAKLALADKGTLKGYESVTLEGGGCGAQDKLELASLRKLAKKASLGNVAAEMAAVALNVGANYADADDKTDMQRVQLVADSAGMLVSRMAMYKIYRKISQIKYTPRGKMCIDDNGIRLTINGGGALAPLLQTLTMDTSKFWLDAETLKVGWKAKAVDLASTATTKIASTGELTVQGEADIKVTGQSKVQIRATSTALLEGKDGVGVHGVKGNYLNLEKNGVATLEAEKKVNVKAADRIDMSITGGGITIAQGKVTVNAGNAGMVNFQAQTLALKGRAITLG